MKNGCDAQYCKGDICILYRCTHAHTHTTEVLSDPKPSRAKCHNRHPITSDSKRLGNNIWFVQNNTASYGLWSVINAVNEYCKRWRKHTHYYTLYTAELPCALYSAMVICVSHKQLVMSQSLFIFTNLTQTPVTAATASMLSVRVRS